MRTPVPPARRSSLVARSVKVFALIATTISFAAVANAQFSYQSDFQNSVTTNWSSSSLTTDANGKRTLGLFQIQTVSLTLPNLASGQYSIAFDFFNLATWDGDENPGPDYFRFAINGTNYINATFANGGTQTYSTSTPLGNGGSFPTATDNSGLQLLSYSRSDGPVNVVRYTPTFTFTHNGGDAVFQFTGAPNQSGDFLGFLDEPWTLDRVRVFSASVVPEPGTASLVLPALTLIGVGVVRRRK